MPESRSGELQNMAAAQPIPGLPENFEILDFEGFEGLNTKPSRPAIGDQQMFWCHNLMPLGRNNLRALADISGAAYGAPSGLTVSYFAFANISATPLSMVFLSDGSIAQFNTATNVSSQIAGANTIVDPTQQIGVAQWGSQFILVCAPQANGFFVWDGNILYQAGLLGPFVNITNSGKGYKTAPTVTVTGGSGVGATVAATINSGGFVTQVTVTNAGSGYGVTDVVVCDFSGGGNGGTTAKGTAVLNSAGSVVAVTVLSANQGLGYNINSVTVSIQGGGGVGATATVTALTGTGINTVAVSASSQGQGYTSVPTVIFTDANNPVAQAVIPIMPFGVQGTSIETFTSRVWITNGAAPSTPPLKNITTFSAPNQPTDFNTGDGAGVFTANDSFLRIGYQTVKQANGFLYLGGDSSWNYISSVTTSGSPPITTFSNNNVDPQIGTPWGNTAQVFGRRIVFANTIGVFELTGGAVRKISNELDGIYPSVTPTGTTPKYSGLVPSSAVSVVNGIHIYCLLLPIIDTVTGSQINALLCWDGTKWWTYQPSVTITQIASQEINSVLTAYGTDNTNIYQLFSIYGTTITKTVQSKLWSRPAFFVMKHATRLFALLKSATNSALTLTAQVDTEQSSFSTQITGLNQMTWTNNSSVVVSWTNNSGTTVAWGLTGIFFSNIAVEASGQLLGLTFKSTAPDFTLVAAALGAQQYKPQL